MGTGAVLSRRSPTVTKSGSFPSLLWGQTWQFCSGVECRPGVRKGFGSPNLTLSILEQARGRRGVRTSPLFPTAHPIPASAMHLSVSPLLGGPVCRATLPGKPSTAGQGGKEKLFFSPKKASKMTLCLTPELLPAPRLPLPHGKSSSSGSRCDNSLIFLSRREAVHWIHQERGKQKEAGGEQAAGRNK